MSTEQDFAGARAPSDLDELVTEAADAPLPEAREEEAPAEPEARAAEPGTEPAKPEGEAAAEPGTKPDAEAPDRQAAGVLRALMDERDKRQAAEQRLRDLEAAEQRRQREQAPADPNALFVDPEGTLARLEQSFTARLTDEALNLDHRFTLQKYGDEFDAAFKAAQSAFPDLGARAAMIHASGKSPGEELVKWHRQQRVLSDVGGDPAAYREKVANEAREAALKDPAFLAKAMEAARAQAAGNPVTRSASPLVMPSLSRAGSPALTGAAPDLSDDERFDKTFTR